MSTFVMFLNPLSYSWVCGRGEGGMRGGDRHTKSKPAERKGKRDRETERQRERERERARARARAREREKE